MATMMPPPPSSPPPPPPPDEDPPHELEEVVVDELEVLPKNGIGTFAHRLRRRFPFGPSPMSSVPSSSSSPSSRSNGDVSAFRERERDRGQQVADAHHGAVAVRDVREFVREHRSLFVRRRLEQSLRDDDRGRTRRETDGVRVRDARVENAKRGCGNVGLLGESADGRVQFGVLDSGASCAFVSDSGDR